MAIPQLPCVHSLGTSHSVKLTLAQKPLPDNTQHLQQTSMSPAGIESKFSAGERPQNSDRASTGIGQKSK